MRLFYSHFYCYELALYMLCLRFTQRVRFTICDRHGGCLLAFKEMPPEDFVSYVLGDELISGYMVTHVIRTDFSDGGALIELFCDIEYDRKFFRAG